MLAEPAANALAAAVRRNHIAGIGHMGAEGEAVGLEVVRPHDRFSGVHRHHHGRDLPHPEVMGLGFRDLGAMGKGLAGAEHRLQQPPHRRPVRGLHGTDRQGVG